MSEKGIENASLQHCIWRFISTRIFFGLFIFLCTLIFGFLGPVSLIVCLKKSYLNVSFQTFFLRKFIGWLSSDQTVQVGISWATGLICCELARIVFFALVWAVNHRYINEITSIFLYLRFLSIELLSDFEQLA